LVGDPEGEAERPEICGRLLAIRPGENAAVVKVEDWYIKDRE
jgi:hypothetical protein